MEHLAAGQLLIADPFLQDLDFGRAVVLLCEHQSTGSFGLCLNKPLNRVLGDLIPDAAGLLLPIYAGGPVQKDSLYFIHTTPMYIPGGVAIIDGVFWGGNFKEVIRLLHDGVLHEEHIRFFVGYSGWAETQLSAEIAEKSWIQRKGSRELIFAPDTSTLWQIALKKMGGEYRALANYPIDPQLN